MHQLWRMWQKQLAYLRMNLNQLSKRLFPKHLLMLSNQWLRPCRMVMLMLLRSHMHHLWVFVCTRVCWIYFSDAHCLYFFIKKISWRIWARVLLRQPCLGLLVLLKLQIWRHHKRVWPPLLLYNQLVLLQCLQLSLNLPLPVTAMVISMFKLKVLPSII